MKKEFFKYVGAVAVCLSVVGIVSAASTISTNISTGGTLSVTGASTLTGAVTHSASTTFSGDLTFDEAATSTVSFGTAGLNFDSSTFVIDPNANRVGILTVAPTTALDVFGTASSTDLVVGSGARVGTGSTPGHITALADDTLLVEGQSEFDGTTWFDGIFHASSTALFGGAATFYGNLTVSQSATTTVTIPSAGINFDVNTFVIDPNANRVGILTATPNTAFEVVGTASTTNLVVGSETSHAGFVSGTCTIAATTVNATSSAHADCTATGVRAGDKIFLTATSSLDSNFYIQAASSSATNNINVRIYNAGYPTADTTAGPASFWFWAVR